MAITASMVKELREATSVGMMDCKKALTETGGDFDAAVKILRERGAAVAAKRADREAKEGKIEAIVSADAQQAAMIEVNCETDFVTRNDDFQAFAAELRDEALNFETDTKLKVLLKKLPRRFLQSVKRFSCVAMLNGTWTEPVQSPRISTWVEKWESCWNSAAKTQTASTTRSSRNWPRI